jgi:N-acetyl sugar amidotransferase
MEKKRVLDWTQRQIELENLFSKHRKSDGRFDCLVPVSGGKDGSYVAYNVKHKYGMNPLTLTVTPPLALSVGEKNLQNFINSGYDHISINPARESMRVLNRAGFEQMGSPYFGWLTSIQSAVVTVSMKLGINLIFYGEDGEVEYGGTNETDKSPIYNVQYMKKIYLEGGYEKVIHSSGLRDKDLNFFTFPETDYLEKSPIDITHWSYFENWDPYRNYLVAKEHCGLQESDENSSGTFTNYAQNDQALYALHTYLMYLKFGFGRATQDASIEIRRGAMDRDQAINLVRLYDGHYPEEFLEMYLDYYDMEKHQFEAILDKWVDKNLFAKIKGQWRPLFNVE